MCSAFYNAGFRDLTLVEALFFGIKAAVLAIVIQAVVKVGKRALKNGYMYAVSAAAFVSIFLFDVPFPLVIIGAGLIGLIGMRLDPDRFVIKGHTTPNENDEAVGGAYSVLAYMAQEAVESYGWLAPIGTIADDAQGNVGAPATCEAGYL